MDSKLILLPNGCNPKGLQVLTFERCKVRYGNSYPFSENYVDDKKEFPVVVSRFLEQKEDIEEHVLDNQDSINIQQDAL